MQTQRAAPKVRGTRIASGRLEAVGGQTADRAKRLEGRESEQVHQPQETARRLQQQHVAVQLSVCFQGFCSIGAVEIEIDSCVRR